MDRAPLALDGIRVDRLLNDHQKHYVLHRRDHHDRLYLDVVHRCDPVRDVMGDHRGVMGVKMTMDDQMLGDLPEGDCYLDDLVYRYVRSLILSHRECK
jgi:hypothetical protein